MNPPMGKLNETQARIDSSKLTPNGLLTNFFFLTTAGVVEYSPDADIDIVAALIKRFFRDLQPAILPAPREFGAYSGNFFFFQNVG